MSSRLLAFNPNDGHYEPLVLQNGTQYLYVTSPTLDDMLVDTDSCVSKLTDISTNASLTASRCSNMQDWIGTSDGSGGGAKTGVNIDSIKTLLTTQATHNTNLLTKNTEIDTALDSIDTKMTSLTTGSNTHQNLYSGGALSAHTFSTTIDMSNHRSISVFGKTTSTSGTLYMAYSTDNVNYYVASSDSMYILNLNSVYYFGKNFSNVGSKYVRIYTTDALADLYLSVSMKN
tara:strand:- start:162 stop:854 length:693 start_codon:yes stop_codon:yes gene_type:complete